MTHTEPNPTATPRPASTPWPDLDPYEISTAWLTKLILNPAHRGVRDDLRDINTMHQTLTKIACPADFGPESRTAAGMLYRVEHTNTGVAVLLQSKTTIDPARLPPGYAHGGSKDLTPLLTHLTDGLPVRYRIVANATKSSKSPDGKGRGARRPLHGDEAATWWKRQATTAGLTPTTEPVLDTTKLRGHRPRDQRTIIITATTLEGTATITHSQPLREAILTGIGRGRAYGCGLLSLAPLSQQ